MKTAHKLAKLLKALLRGRNHDHKKKRVYTFTNVEGEHTIHAKFVRAGHGGGKP